MNYDGLTVTLNSEAPGSPEDSYLIDLLPALPALWTEGSMHGLRARGGFEVDVDWANGRLTSATLRSVGGTTARLRYAGKTIPVKLGPGQRLRVSAPGGELQVAGRQQPQQLEPPGVWAG